MKFCSVAVIALLVYVHLGPAKWQPPRTGLGWQMDHFLGYVAVTSIVCLAWPRRPFVVGGLLMAAAGLLEALQAFTPDRHADLQAALFGACGALTVALLAELFIRVQRRRAAFTAR
jgi:VanZ family protein